MQRTRAQLHEALVALILKKGFKAITVQDIIDQANVGRSTFYAHYTSKEDLLRSGFDNLRASLLAHQQAAQERQGGIEARSLGFSLALFEHARNNFELYAALVAGRGGAVLLDPLRELLSELVRRDIAAILQAEKLNPVEQEIRLQIVVGAFMSVLAWWLARKANLPPTQIDGIFRRYVLQGIASREFRVP